MPENKTVGVLLARTGRNTTVIIAEPRNFGVSVFSAARQLYTASLSARYSIFQISVLITGPFSTLIVTHVPDRCDAFLDVFVSTESLGSRITIGKIEINRGLTGAIIKRSKD